METDGPKEISEKMRPNGKKIVALIFG